MSSSTFDSLYQRLVAAWKHHHDLSGTAELEALYEARRALDERRYEIALARRV